MDDAELDIEGDLIKRFLLHKYEEVKLANSEMQQKIDRRKQMVSECVEKMSHFSQNLLKIEKTWQKNLNGKWIIGMEVKNTSLIGSTQISSITLKWDLAPLFTYQMKTFSQYISKETYGVLPEKVQNVVDSLENKSDTAPLQKEWIEVDDVTDMTVVVVACDILQFITNQECNVSGVLTYRHGSKLSQLTLPNFKVTPKCLVNTVHIVKTYDLLKGTSEDFLSVLVAFRRYNLILKIPETYTTFENILQYELMFRKLDIPSRKNFYFVDGIAGCHGWFFFITSNNTMTVLCSNDGALRSVLHFFYQSIPGILILPSNYKGRILNNQKSLTEEAKTATTNAFGKSLEMQINFLEGFFTKQLDYIADPNKDEVNLNVAPEDFAKFRTDLADLELRSDLLYYEVDTTTDKDDTSSSELIHTDL